MALPPGFRIGQYEVRAQLGAGGMGEVYRAHDPRLGRDVALKVLHPAVARDEVRLERFTREARAVAALNHPHIVTIYSTEEAEGVPFMTMELVEGRVLDELIPREGLSLTRFLELAMPLADALAAAHQKQITHRDLKPGNVMIAADGRLKVLDFGLARVNSTAPEQTIDATRAVLTVEGTIVGTMPYMSPEQVEGRAIDARSDLFSLGVMFYEMLAGTRPFKGPSSPALMTAILRDEPEPLASCRGDVPEALIRLVARCLEKRPDERVQTARDVLNELRHVQKRLESGACAASSAIDLRLAVVPFTVRADDTEAQALADALTDDVTTGLSRFEHLRVLSRAAAAQLAAPSTSSRTGCRYVLDGTIRSAGKAMRVGVRIVDTHTSSNVWAGNFDGDGDAGIFAVQDDLASRIVATVGDPTGVLAKAMLAAIRSVPLEQLGAEALMVRYFAYTEQFRPDDHAQLRDAVERFVEREPASSVGWAMAGGVCHHEHSHLLNPRPDSLGRARQAIERAIALDSQCQHAWVLRAAAYLFAGDSLGVRAAVERAVTINPLNAELVALCALYISIAEDSPRAIELARSAIRLKPGHPGWYHFAVFNALYREGRDEAALTEATQVDMPMLPLTHMCAAATAGQLGRPVDARLALDRLRGINPSLCALEGAGNLWRLWVTEPRLLARLVEGFDKALALAGASSTPPPWAPDRRPEGAPSESAGNDSSARIAVLPFTARGGDIATGLAEGLSDDITTGLSRFPHLRVVPAATAARLTTESAAQAGVRYLLEGRVQGRGSAVRVTVRLIDGATGANLWGDTFDRPVGASAFDVQDELASFVAATVGDTSGVLARSMAASLLQRPVEELTVRELTLRFHAYVEHFQPEEHARLRAGLERALEREPLVAEGWACLADLYEHEHSQRLNPLPDSLGRQRRAAQRALDIDPHNQRGWTAMAGVHTFERDLAGLRMAAERAIALNPLDADTVGLCALFLSCAGDDNRAMELFARAVTLKPQHPGWYHFPPFTTHFKRREYAEALAAAKRIALPQLPTVHISAAAAAARAGSAQEAQAAVEALRRLDPRFLEPEAARQALALWLWDDALVEDEVDALMEAIAMRPAGARPPRSGPSERPQSGPRPAETAAASGELRVALLPFTVRGGDDATALAEGLADEITTGLARFPYLRAVSHAAVTSLDRGAQVPETAAQRLGARFLLEGSVRMASGAIRVSARLVDVESGAHLWAESFYRDTALGLFAVQDDLGGCITSQVADPSGALVRTMASARRVVPVAQMSTTELTLQFFAHLERFDPVEHAALRDAFERALERDPNDATAWGCLADLYMQELTPGLNPRPDPAGRQRAAAERAVALDATCQYGWLALATNRALTGDRTGFVQAGERAIALNPLNTHALSLIGNVLAITGDWDRGLTLVRRALALNPHLAGHVHLATFLDNYRRGDDEAALAAAKRFNIPLLPVGHLNQAAAAGQLGRADEARVALDALRRVDPRLCEPGAAREAFGRHPLDGPLLERLSNGFEKALALVRLPSGDVGPSSESRPASGATSQGSISVSVQPFAARGGDIASGLADGLSEELATGLTRFSYLTLVQAAAARFRVEGSVRASGTSVRVAARLVDASSSAHLWTDQFDRDAAAGVLTVQDELAHRIVVALADESGAVFVRTVGSPLRAQPVHDLTASELVLRFHLYAEQFLADEHAALREGLERAVEREPRHASAWACLSILYAHEAVLGLNPLPDTARRQRHAADRGLALDSSNQMIWIAQAMGAAFTRDLTGLRAACERVVARNPLSSHAVATAAVFLVFAGDVDRAAALVRQVSARSPHHQGWYNFVPFLEAYLRADYERALEYAKRIRMPVFSWCHLSGAAAAGQLGRAAEAQASLVGLRASHPHLLDPDAARREWRAWFWQDEPVDRLLEGLQRALRLTAVPGPSRPPSSGTTARAAGLAISVTPFGSRGGDDAAALAAGLTEDVTTGLSRFGNLELLAGGARYVLDGSVSQAGPAVRVTARAVDSETGATIWAQTYERSTTSGVFPLQDDVASRIVSTVADPTGVLGSAMAATIGDRNYDTLSVAELVVRCHVFTAQLRPVEHARLRQALEQALEREPEAAEGWACLAHLHGMEHGLRLNPLPGSRERERRAAERAVEVDPQSPWAWTALARSHLFARDGVATRAAVDRALALNPLNADMLAHCAIFLTSCGEFDRAGALVTRAMELKPHHQGWFYLPIFDAHYMRGEDEAALDAAKKINMPAVPYAQMSAAAAAGQLGRVAEAKASLDALREYAPELLHPVSARAEWAVWLWSEPLLDRLVEGFEKALVLTGLQPSDDDPRRSSAADAAVAASNLAVDDGTAPTSGAAVTVLQVAVQPFTASAEDADTGELARGLTDDVAAGLSRFRYLRVRSIPAAADDRESRIAATAAGAAYIVNGAVRRRGSLFRVRVRVTDVTSGEHLWVEQYDRDGSTALFDLQDDLVSRIVATLADGGGILGRVLAERLRGAGPQQADGLFAAWSDYVEHFTPDKHAALRDGLEALVARHPDAATAWGYLSILYGHELFFEFNPRPDPVTRVRAAAERAVTLDPDNQTAWYALAEAEFFERHLDALRSAGERAIQLNPLQSRTLGGIGLFYYYAGDTERGAALVARAMSLNPRVPGWLHIVPFLEAYRNDDTSGAFSYATRINMPHLPVGGRMFAIAAAGRFGREREARDGLRLVGESRPDLLSADAAQREWSRWLWEGPLLDDLVDGYAAALAMAGAPTTPPDAVAGPGRASGPAAARPSSGVSDMRVAVLPFSARGGDDAIALAEGLTDDLTTALARFHYLQVVSRAAVRNARGPARDVAARIGARFLLEGTARASSGQLRVSTHLSEVQTGAHLWAETFERDLAAGLFAVQDDIVGRIAATVADGGGALVRTLARRVHGRPIDHLTVDELVLRYNGDFAEHFDPADHAVLRDAFERAVAREPDSAPAWACLSTLCGIEVFFGLNPKPDPLARLRDAAARAVRLDPDHQQGWVGLATAALFDRDRVALHAATERVVQLNPFHGRSLATAGLYAVFAGETSRGVPLVDRAIALNARHPGWYLLAPYLAAYERGDFEAALRTAKSIGMPQFVAGHLAAAAAAGQVGTVDDARPALEALARFDARLIEPDGAREVWSRWIWSDATVQHLVDGLRKALALMRAAT